MKLVDGLATSLAIAIALIGLALEPARSQAPQAADPGDKFADLRGEWQRAGAGFACVVKPPESLQSDKALPDAMARACSFLGAFALGDDPQAVTKLLGAPQRSLAQPQGAKALVYFLGEPGHYPYFIETVLKNRIVALQVSGTAPAKGYGFNHVDLGSPTAVLLEYFGQPLHIGPSGIKGTELWNYRPWPFSFEITDGHVTSIRVGLAD
jgi:hypothetical protein